MNVTQTQRFICDFNNLNENKKSVVAAFINNLIDCKTIDENSIESLVGFPYIYKIDFYEKHIVFYYSKATNTIELSGIVQKGSELSLFF